MKHLKKILVIGLVALLTGCSINTNKIEKRMELVIPETVTISDKVLETMGEASRDNIGIHKDEFPVILGYTAPGAQEVRIDEEAIVKISYNDLMSLELGEKADAKDVGGNSDHYYHFYFADGSDLLILANESKNGKFLYSWIDDTYRVIVDDKGLFDLDMTYISENNAN